MPNTHPHRTAGTIQGIVLLLPVLVTVMDVTLLEPILPAMIKHFAAVPGADGLAQLAMSLPALCVALLGTFAGWLADRTGRRRLSLIALGLYAVFGMAPLVLNSLPAILLSRFALGLAETVAIVCTTTMIGDYFHGHEREKWLAFQSAVSAVGASLLYAASGATAGAFGWRAPFGLNAFAFVMLALLAAFTWEARSDTPHHAQGAGAGTAVSAKFPLGPVLLVCLVTVCAAIGFFMLQMELAEAMVGLHIYDQDLLGAVPAVASLAVPVGAVVFRWVMTRHGLPAQISVSFVCMGLGLILASRSDALPLLFAGACLNLFGAGIALPTVLTWVMRLLSFEQRGRGTGMWTAAFELGPFAVTAMVTFLGAALGGLMPTFFVTGVFLVLAALVAIIAGMISANRPLTA